MDNHLEQARERGDFDDQYPNRESCFCQPLHSGCDPKFCNKAISAPSSEWIEHDEPLEPFKIAGLRTQLGKGAAEGCETCGAILGAGEEISKMYKQGLHHRSDYSERNAVVPARLIAERRPGCLEVREETSITNLVALFKKPGFGKFAFSSGSFLISERLNFRELHQITVRPFLSRRRFLPAQAHMLPLSFAKEDCKVALKLTRLVRNSTYTGIRSQVV